MECAYSNFALAKQRAFGTLARHRVLQIISRRGGASSNPEEPWRVLRRRNDLTPLALLISELSKRKGYRQIYIQKNGLTLRLEQVSS